MADWITTAQACELSGYSANYLRDLIYANRIKAQRWGRSWQVSRSSLQTYRRNVQKLGVKRGPKTKHPNKPLT
jgi:excisionase family DNA binding protein